MRATLDLRVLGPLAVVTNGSPVAPAGALKRRVLARLALSPHQPVTADQLIDALWADDPPRTARQALHVHISQLRAVLRQHGVDDLVRSVGDGYRLGSVVLDVTEFERLVALGRAAAARGDLREAQANLSDADRMWGDPFLDLIDHPVAIGERHRLGTLHEVVVDELHEVSLELDGDTDIEARLQAMVATGVLRERPYAQLIRLYVMTGRTARAKAILDRARRVFDEALRIEPSPALTALVDGSVRPSRQAPRAHRDAAQRIWTSIDDHLGGAVAVVVDQRADLGRTMHHLRDLATAARRPLAVTAAPSTSVVPLSPVLDLLDQRSLDVTDGRAALHRTLTDRLEARLGRGAVIVLDHADRVDDATADYLTALLSAGRSLLTFALVFRSDARSRLLGVASEQVDLRTDDTYEPPAPASLSTVTSGARNLHAFARQIVTPAPVELLVRAFGAGTGPTLRMLDELQMHGLITTDEAGRIAHVDTADASDEGDPAQAHVALATALTKMADPSDPYRLSAEARHRLAALPSGDEHAAWATALRAVRYYDLLGAHGDIVALLEGHDESPDLDLEVLVGRARMRTGHPAGRDTLERVLVRARAADRADVFAEAVRALCEERAPQTSSAELRDLTVEALDWVGDVATDTRVQLMTDLANSAYFSNPEFAEAVALDALAVAERSGSEATIARALTGLVQAVWAPDNASRRLDLSFRAQEAARRGGSVESQILALTYEAGALVELGRLQQAKAPLRYAEALAADVQIPRFRWWAAGWLAVLGFARGDLDDGPFEAAFRLWAHPDRTDAFECYASQLAAHRMLTGRAGEIADAAVQMALNPEATSSHRAVAAAASAMAGDEDRATELLEPFIVDGLPRRRDATFGVTLAMLAEAASVCGTRSLAAPLVLELEPLADHHAVINVWGGGGFYWGGLRHALGLALVLGGDRERGCAELDRAARDQADAGAPQFARRSREAWRSRVSPDLTG